MIKDNDNNKKEKIHTCSGVRRKRGQQVEDQFSFKTYE